MAGVATSRVQAQAANLIAWIDAATSAAIEWAAGFDLEGWPTCANGMSGNTGQITYNIVTHVASGNVVYAGYSNAVTMTDLGFLCAGQSVYTAQSNYFYAPSGSIYANNFIARPAQPARPENPIPPQLWESDREEMLAEWEHDRATHQRALELEIERQRVAFEQHQQRVARQQGERQAADRKAEELLAEHLAPEQREQYRTNKSFEVVLKARFGLGSKRYRINHGWSGNVALLDKDGREVERYCIHHRELIPVPDLLLAQKLMLETDEEQFLKIANRTRLVAA